MLKVVLLLIFLVCNGGCNDGFWNFKLYQCKFNEAFVFPNRTCYAKSFSRKISTINAYAKYKAPLDDVWHEGTLFYKYGNIYRQIMKIPYHSICKTLKVTKEENVLLYQVNLMLRKDDDSLDECPFKQWVMTNFSIRGNLLLSVFPSGDYKLSELYTFGNGTSIYNSTVVVEVLTSLKENFG